MDDRDFHEVVVNELEHRLAQSGRYHSIETHVPYFYKGNMGEADLIAIGDSFIHYYEVKCRFHPRNYDRALQQFSHFSQTNPVLPVKFIYVSSEKVKRVYLK